MTARRYLTLFAALVVLAVCVGVMLGLPLLVIAAAMGWL